MNIPRSTCFVTGPTAFVTVQEYLPLLSLDGEKSVNVFASKFPPIYFSSSKFKSLSFFLHSMCWTFGDFSKTP